MSRGPGERASRRERPSGRDDGFGPAARNDRAVPRGPTLFERVFFGSIGSGQLAIFCRQAASYLEAGVRLDKALESLHKQFATGGLGPVIERVRQRVKQGDDLTEAMSREPQAFDTFFLSMVKVAEARGGLPEVLRRMADHYENRQRLIRQARSAAIYPAIVILIAVGVGWLLTAFVLPKLVELLEDILRGRGGLPGPTRALMALSRFMQNVGWWLVPVAVIGGLFALKYVYKTPPGKALLDRIVLMVPVIGSLLRKIETARFASSMSALLDAGVDYGESIDLTANVVRLSPIRNAVAGTKDAVLAGSELSAALDRTRQFAPDVIATIETGEETGKLPETLHKLAESYEEQVEYMVKNLGSLLQPLLVLMVGAFVFFIVLGFISAYITVLTGLAGGDL